MFHNLYHVNLHGALEPMKVWKSCDANTGMGPPIRKPHAGERDSITVRDWQQTGRVCEPSHRLRLSAYSPVDSTH